jgi:hypothetical protein
MVTVTEDRLRTLLRVAESAHEAYEREQGERDDDWPTWYANFIVNRLEEEPEGGGSHSLRLDDEEHRLLVAAVHSYLDDFGHEEADVLRQLKELHAKVEAS